MFENNYTIGVEEEYMICNPTDGELINMADEIISKIPDNLKDRFSYELLLSEIESNTVICDNVKDACSNILFNRKEGRKLQNKREGKKIFRRMVS